MAEVERRVAEVERRVPEVERRVAEAERWWAEVQTVLRIRIRDPGLGTFLTPGSGIRDGRKSASGSGIRDEQPGSYFLELRNHFFAFLGVKILKFFYDDPGSGMETVRIREPGWKKVGSGIRDKHPGSATLVFWMVVFVFIWLLYFLPTVQFFSV